MHRLITSTHMTPAHTLHATTRTCAIAHICPYRTIVTVSMREVSLRACANFHCECARAYLNFGASVPKSSNTLEHARSDTSLSQRSFEYARSENCERAQFFSASVCEVPLRACASVFETSVQAHPKVQIRFSSLAVKLCSRSVASSTLAVQLCCRSIASSTLAATLRVLSQRGLESTRSLDHTRSFSATIVEASTHSSGSKLRYTRSFYFFR